MWQTQTAGGPGGGTFSDVVPDGGRLARVTIRAGAYIDGIGISYVAAGGKWVDCPFHGGPGGATGGFDLAPGEYILGVDGRSGLYVDSLTFYTSLDKSYDPYGGSGGGPFTLGFLALAQQGFGRDEVPMKVQGIAGRSGLYLDAISFWGVQR